MRIRPFGVEQWMNAHETRCRLNLAETCVESLTVGELLALAGASPDALHALLPMTLTYGAIEGSARLRTAIAGLYHAQAPSSVLVAHGAIGANMLVYQALIEPGDRVVSLVPTYQQHTAIPESLGAEVRTVPLREDRAFQPDPDEVRRALGQAAKLLVLANPNNPTGALVDAAALTALARLAEAAGAYVLCDEVYRGLTQVGDALTPSIVDLTPRGIAVGSMSKAFSLAGLRLGWLVAPPEVITAAERHRDYSTISVGMIDDHFAALALEHRDAVLARSRAVVRSNLAVLDGWVRAEPAASYVRPRAGTTALVKLDVPMTSRAFCERLLDQAGVLLTPGSAMDMEGYVRIGYANAGPVLREGLAATSEILRSVVQQA
jgi:aspartate/methionine/tyrosine aminotransferase